VHPTSAPRSTLPPSPFTLIGDARNSDETAPFTLNVTQHCAQSAPGSEHAVARTSAEPQRRRPPGSCRQSALGSVRLVAIDEQSFVGDLASAMATCFLVALRVGGVMFADLEQVGAGKNAGEKGRPRCRKFQAAWRSTVNRQSVALAGRQMPRMSTLLMLGAVCIIQITNATTINPDGPGGVLNPNDPVRRRGVITTRWRRLMPGGAAPITPLTQSPCSKP
jgi:hypothetical protein